MVDRRLFPLYTGLGALFNSKLRSRAARVPGALFDLTSQSLGLGDHVGQ